MTEACLRRAVHRQRRLPGLRLLKPNRRAVIHAVSCVVVRPSSSASPTDLGHIPRQQRYGGRQSTRPASTKSGVGRRVPRPTARGRRPAHTKPPHPTRKPSGTAPGQRVGDAPAPPPAPPGEQRGGDETAGDAGQPRHQYRRPTQHHRQGQRLRQPRAHQVSTTTSARVRRSVRNHRPPAVRDRSRRGQRLGTDGQTPPLPSTPPGRASATAPPRMVGPSLPKDMPYSLHVDARTPYELGTTNVARRFPADTTTFNCDDVSGSAGYEQSSHRRRRDLGRPCDPGPRSVTGARRRETPTEAVHRTPAPRVSPAVPALLPRHRVVVGHRRRAPGGGATTARWPPDGAERHTVPGAGQDQNSVRAGRRLEAGSGGEATAIGPWRPARNQFEPLAPAPRRSARSSSPQPRSAVLRGAAVTKDSSSAIGALPGLPSPLVTSKNGGAGRSSTSRARLGDQVIVPRSSAPDQCGRRRTGRRRHRTDWDARHTQPLVLIQHVINGDSQLRLRLLFIGDPHPSTSYPCRDGAVSLRQVGPDQARHRKAAATVQPYLIMTRHSGQCPRSGRADQGSDSRPLKGAPGEVGATSAARPAPDTEGRWPAARSLQARSSSQGPARRAGERRSVDSGIAGHGHRAGHDRSPGQEPPRPRIVSISTRAS